MEKMRIPIFKLDFDETFRAEFHEGCERIFSEAYLTNHTYVREFEDKFAAFAKAKHCVAASNGTTAIELALRGVDVRGKDVLLPTNTFIATAAAVINAGGTPVPLDIDDRAFGLSAKHVEKHLKPGLGAVIAVHVGGIISEDLPKIAALCRELQVPLVEDCAHAHAATLNGVPAGAFGAAGAFSFHMTKVMTMGEGGAVVCSDPALAERLRSIRQFGVDPATPLLHVREGSNFKMNEFQALMGVIELKRARGRIEKRRAIAARYVERLRGTDWTAIEPSAGAYCPHYKQIVLPPIPRDRVVRHLESRGIALTGGVYHFPLHRQPVFAEQFRGQSFPVADRFCDTHICPPCYPELTLAEVDQVCDAMLESST